MADFNTIKLVPIIGATFVGTLFLYIALSTIPALHAKPIKGGCKSKKK